MKNTNQKTLADFFECDTFEKVFKNLKKAELDAREFYFRLAKQGDYLGEIARHCLDFYSAGDFMAKNEKSKEKALFKFLQLLFENFLVDAFSKGAKRDFFANTQTPNAPRENKRLYKFLKERIGQNCLLKDKKQEIDGRETFVADFGNPLYAFMLLCEVAERILKTEIDEYTSPRYSPFDENQIGKIVFDFDKLKSFYSQSAFDFSFPAQTAAA